MLQVLAKYFKRLICYKERRFAKICNFSIFKFAEIVEISKTPKKKWHHKGQKVPKK